MASTTILEEGKQSEKLVNGTTDEIIENAYGSEEQAKKKKKKKKKKKGRKSRLQFGKFVVDILHHSLVTLVIVVLCGCAGRHRLS